MAEIPFKSEAVQIVGMVQGDQYTKSPVGTDKLIQVVAGMIETIVLREGVKR